MSPSATLLIDFHARACVEKMSCDCSQFLYTRECEMPFVQAIRGDQFDQCKVAFSVSAEVTVDAISSVTDPLPFHLL